MKTALIVLGVLVAAGLIYWFSRPAAEQKFPVGTKPEDKPNPGDKGSK